MYQTMIDQALADPNTSDFVRQVLTQALTTGQITDADYQEARNHFVQCMADRGWTVSLTDVGYSVTGTPGGPHDGAGPNDTSEANDDGQCEDSAEGPIEPIYLGMKYNPDGLNNDQLIKACYTKNNVPDGQGMSDDEFVAMIHNSAYRPSTDQAELCILDPDGSNGVTLEEAKAARAS